MKFFTHNIWWKLLSLAAAFGVWLNIASEPELASIISAPVEYKNYPKDLEISSNIVEAIDFEARGPAGQLRDLGESRIAAVVDFASVQAPGERTFTLTQAELNLPRGIELIRTIPTQLRFRFEHRKRRSLPVKVLLSGSPAPGFTATVAEVSPPDLEITGPESRVNAANSAISDPFDVSHVTADTQRTLAVFVSEPEVRFLGPARVKVKIHIERTQ